MGRFIWSAVAVGLFAGFVAGQYPKVPKEVQAAEDARRAAYEKAEDEAWEKAQPELAAWAAKGKPYLPGAAKPADLPQAGIPAFPGAWGGGMYSFGGRGGKVYAVTSLDDAGPGTLREACNAIGPRTVVFHVGGVIHLKNRIRIRAPYITIAGQTAPGDGICIRGATVAIDTHDVVIRHLRFRRGETNVANRDDSLGGNPVGNIMLDHLSASWGLDENLSMYRHMYRPPGGNADLKLPTVNITIQWCVSSEALDTFNHSLGSTIGGHNSGFHHNLWACNAGRNPSIGMDGDFNFANNVLFNWRHRTLDGGDQKSLYSVVNNYYKPGPATPDSPIAHRVLRPDGRRPGPDKTLAREWGRAYVAGNVVVGNAAVTADNWAGGVQTDGDEDSKVILPRVRSEKPFPTPKMPVQPAAEAYEAVLANAGATLPKRDGVDRRIVEQVRTGTVPAQSKEGIITDVQQVGGYPEYRGGGQVTDTDGDGIPDDWEREHGLDPNDPADAAKIPTADGYTNLEKYLNRLDR
ncbi:polysaccharide lyase [Limnoglobus roseus]|uniref:Pectate lyase n=1 Tax=Limnoglobus roseus TaxID=2598579 RepID=A0A5C1AJS5_9BACT|nr:polysaccharide lyase [Limnoglobus roseus]QEL17952.1 pectate lyase [Limnoglobus roseus]